MDIGVVVDIWALQDGFLLPPVMLQELGYVLDSKLQGIVENRSRIN